MGGYLNFTGIWDLIEKVQSTSEGTVWRYALSQQSLQDEIIRLNTESQLYDEGIDSKGFVLDNSYNPFTSPGQYSPFTIEVKRTRSGMGGRYDHITLYGLGNFYRSFYVEFDDDFFYIRANGDKGKDNLFDMFGEDILGLTPFNTIRIQPIVHLYYGDFIANNIFRIG